MPGRYPRWILLLGCFLSFAASNVRAQIEKLSDAGLPAFLERVRANTALNAKQVQQYTSDEFWHNRNFDKKGKTTLDESAKCENVFVEGLPYRKKVEANGKPLAGKEAEAEEKRYEKAVRERRAMTTEQKRMSLHTTWHTSLPMCCLATLFSNHIVGFEKIDGRDTVVIESLPLPDARPRNGDEKSALDWKQKSWIDLGDAMFARVEAESLSDKNHVAKGMTIRMDFERIADDQPGKGQPGLSVWLPHASTQRFGFKMLWVGVTGITEQTWSNYRKFHVDMRLLEETVTPVSAEACKAQE